MIQIIPSISVYQGKCVKIARGDFENPVFYDENPVELAQALEENGIKRMHLIDLDGAKKGRVVNYPILQMMAAYTDMEIDFSGGISTDSDVRTAFEYGAKYITAASVAAIERHFFSSWIVSYGREKVILAADTLNGKIMARGWQKNTGIDLMEHIGFYYERGIKYVKCTDVSRDGTMKGPDLDLYSSILEKFPNIHLLACGSVGTIEDIEKLQEIGVKGVMIGRALYEGKIKLEELRYLASSSI